MAARVLLIAEADPATVFLARRLLTRELGCGTVETDDGLEVLHALSGPGTYAALLLGMELASMPAFEVIEAVRSHPPTRDLPIVVLTGERQEATIRQLMARGVRHCLAKPLDPVRAAATLRRALDAAQTPRVIERRPGRPELVDGATLLVADADADFRHFSQAALGHRFRVLVASSGAEALRMIERAKPAVVCAGDRLGLLTRDMLARRICEWTSAGDLPLLVAITGRAEQADAERSGLFDGVVRRTFVTAAFREQLEGVVGRPSPLPRLVHVVPDLRARLLTAVAQSIGMMMDLELDALPTGPIDACDGLTATVDLAVGIGDAALTVPVSVGLTPSLLQLLAGRMLGLDAAAVEQDDALSVLGELTNIVAGRVQHAFLEHKMSARTSLPRVEQTPRRLQQLSDEIAVRFQLDGCIGILQASLAAREGVRDVRA